MDFGKKKPGGNDRSFVHRRKHGSGDAEERRRVACGGNLHHKNIEEEGRK